MRLIDGDELMDILTTAIRNIKGMAKLLSAEDDPEIQMEIKAYTDIANGVRDMPTAEPEQRWIPCSERLPEETERYIITAYDGVSRRTTTAMFQKRPREWCLSGRMAYWRVVAWMPLPDPFQKEKK